MKDKLSPNMKDDLNSPFTINNVYKAMNQLRAMAAPRQDGIPTHFYQSF